MPFFVALVNVGELTSALSPFSPGLAATWRDYEAGVVYGAFGFVFFGA